MAYTFYHELEGSPTVEFDRHTGTATRIVLIAWEDINLFFAELFPDPYNGYLGSAYFPGYEWLRVSKAKVEPWQPSNPLGLNEPMSIYPGGAKVTVTYEPPSEDQGQQGGPKGDHSGPGGSKGSSGGNQGQDQGFVKHKVSVGGQYLSIPKNRLQWELSSKTGLPYSGPVIVLPSPIPNEFAVASEITAQTIVPVMEHTISWNFVPWPPWTVMRQCLGKVNSGTFAGCPDGCALFTGAEASRVLTPAGVPSWSLDYKFSERNTNADNPLAPQGWNYFLRPDGVQANTYQLILTQAASADNNYTEKYVFPETSFGYLFLPGEIL